MNEVKTVDPVLEGLSHADLKDTIIRLVKDINKIKSDAKDFAKSCREAVREREERIDECLELLNKSV